MSTDIYLWLDKQGVVVVGVVVVGIVVVGGLVVGVLVMGVLVVGVLVVGLVVGPHCQVSRRFLAGDCLDLLHLHCCSHQGALHH